MILQLMYLYLPAYLANLAPLLVKSVLPRWNAPLDFGRKWRGERVLGSHKTWRGLITGVSAGLLTAYAQYALGPASWSMIDYSLWPAWGLLLSLGALGGDALKSFFKRRIRMKPGASWMPFDQVDYALGALALGSLMHFPGWTEAALVLLISVALHLAVSTVGYYTGVRKERW